MLIKIFGVIDLIGGLFLIFKENFEISNLILIIFGFVFLAKSLLGLLKNFASWIDFLSGIIFLLSIAIPIPGMICLILGLLIIQKGAFSFL